MTHKESELLVADSFRVRAHRQSGELEVRNLHAHFARFKAYALEAWQSEELEKSEQRRVSQVIETFLEDSRQPIASFGVGWPRFELWGVSDTQQKVITDQKLRVSLRPLPDLGQSIEARTAEHTPVVFPNRKGPNIDGYARLNQELGAEALLTDEFGRVIEGASTSVMWWRDGALCVSQDGGRVPSVTEHALRDFATHRGISVHLGRELPSALSIHETWAVNALHGIRTVKSIDGVALPSPNEDRLDEFRVALDATWQPVLRPDPLIT